jgi:P27 family predicted phage terminase small subunit
MEAVAMAGARGSGGHSRVGPKKKGAESKLTDAIAQISPPNGLSEAASDYWRYYAAILRDRKLWTVSARDTLRCYCDALVSRDRMQAQLDVEPLTFLVPKVDPDGGTHDEPRAHPLLAQIRAVRLECRQHANDLCLPPAAAIRVPGQAAEDEEPKTAGHDFYGEGSTTRGPM